MTDGAGPRPPPGAAVDDGDGAPGRRAGSTADARSQLDALWSLCLAAADGRRRGDLPQPGARIDAATGDGCLVLDEALRWRLDGHWSDAARRLFALYAPMLPAEPRARHVSAHLGQSLDGRIATANGDSRGLSDAQNLLHLHRMRALADAVVIGADTALADDPQLTTRLVDGPCPVRVVLDRRGRVDARLGLCRDGRAPTLIVRGPSSGGGGQAPGDADDADGAKGTEVANGASIGLADVLRMPAETGRFDLDRTLDALAARGLRVVFVEGGGLTVSAFLGARRLDRLQVSVTPLLIGSGRPGITLAPISAIGDGLRPPFTRHDMGEDVLWDFDLSRHR